MGCGSSKDDPHDDDTTHSKSKRSHKRNQHGVGGSGDYTSPHPSATANMSSGGDGFESAGPSDSSPSYGGSKTHAISNGSARPLLSPNRNADGGNFGRSVVGGMSTTGDDTGGLHPFVPGGSASNQAGAGAGGGGSRSGSGNHNGGGGGITFMLSTTGGESSGTSNSSFPLHMGGSSTRGYGSNSVASTNSHAASGGVSFHSSTTGGITGGGRSISGSGRNQYGGGSMTNSGGFGGSNKFSLHQSTTGGGAGGGTMMMMSTTGGGANTFGGSTARGATGGGTTMSLMSNALVAGGGDDSDDDNLIGGSGGHQHYHDSVDRVGAQDHNDKSEQEMAQLAENFTDMIMDLDGRTPELSPVGERVTTPPLWAAQK